MTRTPSGAAARAERAGDGAVIVDLAHTPVRDLNHRLHRLTAQSNERLWRVLNAAGKHALAVGLSRPIDVVVVGHTGYYCGGMNQAATLTIEGHAGPGVAENMMSGVVRVRGNASASAGASGRGGLLVIEGDAASRCGISMKGIDIVVGGSVGHMAAFLGQAGRLVVCGDAGDDLGDSIYEAAIYVRGKVGRLGADCIEKPMTPAHRAALAALLKQAAFDHDPAAFRRFGSARKLYHYHVDNADAYA
jgi:glutamate synthase domain-containing protein 3